jgi:hypothetical protein
MNSNSTTTRRAVATIAAAAVMFSAAACGTEIQAPTNDIGRHQRETDKAPSQAPRTTIQRGSFGDEYGQARARKHHSTPAGSGTRNRMDFRDRGF